MALSYAELFEDLGKLVKYYNAFAGDGQALSADVDAILAVFANNHVEEAVDGLRPGAESAWKSEYAGRRGLLATYAAQRLTDRDSVLLEIGAVSSNIDEALAKLIEQFYADSETINASAASIGSVSAHGDNIGNGTVLTTPLLDKVTSPGTRSGVSMPSHHTYGDLTTELVVNETMAIRCSLDSYAGGSVEGGETFSWEGDLADSAHGVETTEGSGSIGSIQAIHANTERYLANADFTTFTVANTPDSWTIVAGAVGTNIFSSSGSNAYHGTTGLNFRGNGVATSVEISQAVTAASLVAGKRYCVTCRLKADATIAAGALLIQFEGTGYTAGTPEKISIAAGSLPTSWTLQHFFVLVPSNVPSDFKLVIRWSGTPTNAKNIYLDDFGVGEVSYGAGMGAVVVRGATPFVKDDRFSFAVTTTEGVFQKFFRRVFGVQLPSDAAAAETIADSLAT